MKTARSRIRTRIRLSARILAYYFKNEHEYRGFEEDPEAYYRSKLVRLVSEGTVGEWLAKRKEVVAQEKDRPSGYEETILCSPLDLRLETTSLSRPTSSTRRCAREVGF